MKRGGSRMGYTEQFNLLSPCYKDGEQPAGFHMGGVKAKPTKKGTKAKATKAKKPSTKKTKTKPKQRGGSSCGASLSVAEMGVVDRPASLEPTKSERAWDNRMKGGGLNGNNSLNLSSFRCIKCKSNICLFLSEILYFLFKFIFIFVIVEFKYSGLNCKDTAIKPAYKSSNGLISTSLSKFIISKYLFNQEE